MSAQSALVASWVREILALPPHANVSVDERKPGEVAISVSRDGVTTTHVIAAPLKSLTWPVTAGALLHLGKSCAEHDHS